TGGSVRMLAPHRRLGLELLLECLTQANFPKEAFERQKARLLSDIDEAEEQPETKAAHVYKEMVYGKHPFGRPPLGRRKVVEGLTPEDCAAFHRRVFVPNNTLMAIVGDFASKECIDELTKLTAGSKQGGLPSIDPPAGMPRKGCEERIG